jgi:hypothetical protein
MSPSAKLNVVLPLAATVRTEEGIRTVSRGEELPDNVTSEERERLLDNGVLGTAQEAAALPANVVTEPVERPTPREAAQAAINQNELAELQARQAEDAAAKQAELIADQQGENAPAPASTGPAAPGVNSPNEDFDAYVAEAKVDDAVAAVNAVPEDERQAYAQALLDAENSVRDEPRKSLVEKLTSLASDE